MTTRSPADPNGANQTPPHIPMEYQMRWHVQRLTRLFHKRSGEGLCTKPFDRFSHECRTRLLTASKLDGDESPIVACLFSSQSWALLTTKRLLWQKHTYRAAVPLQAISRTSLHHGKIARRHPELPIALVHLRIVTTKGHLHTIDLEAGPSCFGLQYLLRKTIQRRSLPPLSRESI
jgi:hypothetical protein